MTLPMRVLAAAVIAGGLLCSSDAKSRKNILFIVCDDLNTHVSSSGYGPIHTPSFDLLAAEGTTFRRAYCQYPVCGPSRASFLSGLYPESTGVLGNKTDLRKTRPGTVTLPQAFKSQGYWTAATGKIFHNTDMDHGQLAWHESTRFRNDEMPIEAEARKTFEARHGPVTERKNRKRWKEFLPTVAPQTRGQMPGYGPSGLRDEQHADGKNAKQAVSWIDNKSFGPKPFFIAVGIHKPHGPFLAPEAYFDLYPREKLTYVLPPSDFWMQQPKSSICKRYEGFGFELGVENASLRREYMQAYHACISFVDAQIGTVFESLKRNGLWENTIVILTSDHGYQLGEHFMWGKVTLFEVCDHVPLVVRVPGMTRPGSASEALVELIDLYPTLAELAAVKPPEDLQGRSMVPILSDPDRQGKRVAYTVVSRGKELGRTVRTRAWRYALWPDGEELFHLKEDPDEHRNLARNPEHAARLKEMRGLLEAKRAAAGG